jgi:hypothetical protein
MKTTVGDMLRLTLLAPDIIEMILDGRHPPILQFESLRQSLPLAWDEQRRATRGLGMIAPSASRSRFAVAAAEKLVLAPGCRS